MATLKRLSPAIRNMFVYENTPHITATYAKYLSGVLQMSLQASTDHPQADEWNITGADPELITCLRHKNRTVARFLRSNVGRWSSRFDHPLGVAAVIPSSAPNAAFKYWTYVAVK